MEIKTIIDFSRTEPQTQWKIVNDGVMGGHSTSSMTLMDNNAALFSGVLSLENSGGFASTRAMVIDLDLKGYSGIRIRVMGDGRCYQLRLRTDSDYDGVAFRHSFQTADGEWMDIVLPFIEFEASFRGQPLPQFGPLAPEEIQQVGLLIADKRSGPFRLIIDSIVAYREV